MGKLEGKWRARDYEKGREGGGEMVMGEGRGYLAEKREMEGKGGRGNMHQIYVYCIFLLY